MVWVRCFFALIFLLSSYGTAESKPTRWVCDPQRWVGDPGLVDGVYRGTLNTRCKVSEKSTEGVKPMWRSIHDSIVERGNFHGKPLRIRINGLDGWSFDHTLKFKDGGNDIELREEVHLVSDQRNQLLYRTRSKDVRASGMASYLKRIGFTAKVRWNEVSQTYEVELDNTVYIERPWYAIAPIFVALAKNISKKKFQQAQAEILPLLTRSL